MVEQSSASDRPTNAARRKPWRWVLLALVVLAIGVGGRWSWIRYWSAHYAAQCQRARETSDWPAMALAAASWASLEPGGDLPWLFRAEAAQEQGDLESVVGYLDQLPNESPKTVPALLERCNILFGPLNRPLEAAATCERILAIEPRTPEAHRRLIFFYAATLQRTKVMQQARSAIELRCDAPETYIYLIGADWMYLSNGFDLTSRWLTGQPDNELLLVARDIQFVRTHGIDEGDAGATGNPSEGESAADRESPLRRLEQGLTQFPHNQELLAYFLDRKCTEGDLVRVSELLAEAPESAVNDNRFWRYKGWLNAAQGDFAEAETAYRQALALHPFDWAAQHQLADALRKKGNLGDVEKLAKVSLEGKELRKAILELPDVQTVPRAIVLKMASYAKKCGDLQIAAHLNERHSAMSGNP